jgi:hypothetical protein
VTTRSWQVRWSEHRRAIEAGSPLLFHRKLREELDAGRVIYIHHKVMGITDDLEALYATEEMLVEGHWTDERRLNMIPGDAAEARKAAPTTEATAQLRKPFAVARKNTSWV